MTPSKWVGSAALLSALLGPAAAFAQSQQPTAVPGFELERLELNPGGEGSLLLGTGQLMPIGGYRVSLLAHYERNPLTYYIDGARYSGVVRDRITAHLTGAYAPTRWLELGLQVPVVLFQDGVNLSALGMASPARTGLDTPIVSARVGILSQRDGNPLDLALELGLGLPFGSSAVLGRDAGLRYSPRVTLGRDLGVVRVGLEGGALLRRRSVLSPDSEQIRDELGNELRGGVSVAMTGQGLRGELGLLGARSLSRQPSSLEMLLGARLPLGASAEVFAVAGVGFGAAPGTPVFRALAGIALGSERPAARPLPGVQAAPVLHCEPGRPHTLAECPDLDDDGDGVKNGQDRCPTEAGPASNQGCPPKDTDGDGVPDDQDRCPNEAGPASNLGCPLKDTDGDGVPDNVDNCPNEPGPADNHGCPKQEKQLVQIAKEKLVINGKLFFDFDRATIQAQSFPLLNQVANVLKNHAEITIIHIEGHTDNVGGREYNLKLSQDRAESVRRYLIEQGVAPERLEAKGYGMERPIETNETEKGRENNRRVEFFISTEKNEKDQTEVPQ